MAEDFTEATSMSIEEATESLLAQSEDQAVKEDQETEQVETDEDAQDDAEVTDETPDDETEETETDEDDSEDAELFFEIEGEEISLAQLKEWREGGLKSADYTQKTQAVAAERKQVEADRIAVTQEHQAIQAERAQLQDALAALAIDGEQEPDWVAMAAQLTPQQYQLEQAAWNKKVSQKQQAAQAYQSLIQEQGRQTMQREMAALMQARPEWAKPDEQVAAFQRMANAAAAYGFAPEEIQGQNDHRVLLLLDELATLRMQVGEINKAKEAVSKRVVKAQPRKVPGARSSKAKGNSKALKAKQAQFSKTRGIDDAVEMLMAGLNNS